MHQERKMKFQLCLIHGLLIVTYLLVFSMASASSEQAKGSGNTNVMTLSFGGIDYLHRWSKDGQNEFTPRSDADLATWRDMVTVNVHEKVTNGDQLAEVANKVLGNYKNRGKILRTDSKPRTADRPAEHLIAAVLGDPAFLEAAFARFLLMDGVGYVVVYSHRVYGKAAGPAMSKWLETNGPQVEKTLMNWDRVPALAALKRLPQSK
jgi:hypothetical protein